MIEMSVTDVVKNDENYVVMLADKEKKRVLPIWVGSYEGASIALGLRAYPTRRPMTHSFIINLLSALDASLEEVRIEVLKDQVFYGVAKLRSGEMVKELDARPSDILALAVRTGSPILVSEEVLDQAGVGAEEEKIKALSSGEGVEAILKEFEVKMKKMLPPEEGKS